MENKLCEILLSVQKKELSINDANNKILELFGIKSLLPTHIESGEEAKRYSNMMNSKGEHNGFHEIDFYNGTVWLRDFIEKNLNSINLNKQKL